MVRAAAARVLLFPQRFIVAYAAQGLLTKPFLFIKTVAQFIFIAHAAQSAVIGVFFPAGAHISVVFAVRRKSGNRPVPNAPPLPYRVRRMLLHSVFTGRSGLLRRWGRCRLGRLRLCGGRIFRETLHLRAKRGQAALGIAQRGSDAVGGFLQIARRRQYLGVHRRKLRLQHSDAGRNAVGGLRQPRLRFTLFHLCLGHNGCGVLFAFSMCAVA